MLHTKNPGVIGSVRPVELLLPGAWRMVPSRPEHDCRISSPVGQAPRGSSHWNRPCPPEHAPPINQCPNLAQHIVRRNPLQKRTHKEVHASPQLNAIAEANRTSLNNNKIPPTYAISQQSPIECLSFLVLWAMSQTPRTSASLNGIPKWDSMSVSSVNSNETLPNPFPEAPRWRNASSAFCSNSKIKWGRSSYCSSNRVRPIRAKALPYFFDFHCVSTRSRMPLLRLAIFDNPELRRELHNRAPRKTYNSRGPVVPHGGGTG